MANLDNVRLAVYATRAARPVTDTLYLPVVDAAGDDWEVSFAFNAMDQIVATVTTSVRDPETAPPADA